MGLTYTGSGFGRLAVFLAILTGLLRGSGFGKGMGLGSGGYSQEVIGRGAAGMPLYRSRGWRGRWSGGRRILMGVGSGRC